MYRTWISLSYASFNPGLGIVIDSIANTICVICCFNVYNEWYQILFYVCHSKCNNYLSKWFVANNVKRINSVSNISKNLVLSVKPTTGN